VYPPGGGRFSVEVWGEDLGRLEPEEFLNDTVIDYYMRWGGR
jgi:sentrin-specific protease 7